MIKNEIITIATSSSIDKVKSSITCICNAVGEFCLFEPEIYNSITTKLVKKLNKFDCESIGKFLLTFKFMFNYFGQQKKIIKFIDLDVFIKIIYAIIESDSFTLFCTYISTLYELLPIITGDLRMKCIKDIIMKDDIFYVCFCHWSYYVRMFFYELLLYRITISPSHNRIKANTLLPEERNNYHRFNTNYFVALEHDKFVSITNDIYY